MSERLRVLSIAHTAVSRDAGRLRYLPLAADPDLEVQLVVPARWHQFGRWYEADRTVDPGVNLQVQPIVLPRAGPASWYLHVYPRLGPVVRRFAPHVVHLWEEPWSAVALQGSILARRCDAALVLEVDQNILKKLPPPFEWIRRQVLRRTDMILSRSTEATEVVRACGYVGPATPIGYGVDETTFQPGAMPVAPPPPLRLGYVGRIVPEKGLDDVLDALKVARADVRLAILGEGPHAPGLGRRAAALGLSDRVSFRPWEPPEEVARFMRGQHALVLPTRTSREVKEQFGRVIIEAQACGVPVIGSRSGAIPDVVGSGGWIVPERDPAALAALLERLARVPGELAERSWAGRANVAARFTYPAVAASLAAAWRTAAVRRGLTSRSAGGALRSAELETPAGDLT